MSYPIDVLIAAGFGPFSYSPNQRVYYEHGGAEYVIHSRDITNLKAKISKSTNLGVTWTVMDDANAPVGFFEWTVTKSGSKLYFIFNDFGGSSAQVKLYTFDMATDTWSSLIATTNAPTAVNEDNFAYVLCSATFSDGNIILFFNSAKETISAIDYDRVSYATLNIGTLVWTTAVQVYGAGLSEQYKAVSVAVDSSDRAHFFFVAEPIGPAVVATLRHRTLVGSTLNTATVVYDKVFSYTVGSGGGIHRSMGYPHIYNDGTERVSITIAANPTEASPGSPEMWWATAAIADVPSWTAELINVTGPVYNSSSGQPHLQSGNVYSGARMWVFWHVSGNNIKRADKAAGGGWNTITFVKTLGVGGGTEARAHATLRSDGNIAFVEITDTSVVYSQSVLPVADALLSSSIPVPFGGEGIWPLGPFMFQMAGALYLLTESNDPNAHDIEALKSLDGGVTWVPLGSTGSGALTTGSAASGGYAATAVGTKIYCTGVLGPLFGDVPGMQIFDTATDTWGAFVAGAPTASGATVEPVRRMVALPSGDLILFHSHAVGGLDRAYFAIYSGGTWGVPGPVFGAGLGHQIVYSLAVDSVGRVYFFFREYPSGALPATSLLRCVVYDGALSSPTTIETIAQGSDATGSLAVVYNDGSGEKVALCWRKNHATISGEGMELLSVASSPIGTSPVWSSELVSNVGQTPRALTRVLDTITFACGKLRVLWMMHYEVVDSGSTEADARSWIFTSIRNGSWSTVRSVSGPTVDDLIDLYATVLTGGHLAVLAFRTYSGLSPLGSFTQIVCSAECPCECAEAAF